jgi:DNA segregation ATPase FtsK/SpoIIIE, S-DNA-T family
MADVAARMRSGAAGPRTGAAGRARAPGLPARVLTGWGLLWRSALALRLRGVLGAVFGAVLIASFATYRAADPSWNSSSGDAPRNAMGGFGAIVSDVGLQSFGLAAWVGALMIVIWGFNRAGAADPRLNRAELRVRGAAGALGMLLLAGALASPQPPADWPMARGLGGVFGDALLEGVAHALAVVRLPQPHWIAGGLLALCAAPALAFGASLRWRDVTEFHTWLAGQPRRTAEPKVEPAPSAKPARAPRPKRERPAKATRQPLPLPPEVDDEVQPAPAPQDAPDSDDPPFDLDDEPAPIAGPSTGPQVAALRVAPPKPSEREERERQKGLDLGDEEPGFMLPELDMLSPPKPRAGGVDAESLKQNARMLETVLAEFGVRGQIDQIRPGPVVTLYELVPAAGVKSSRVIALADDIARSMSARACRVSVVQGRNAIGIELPNASRETVYLRSLLGSPEYEKASAGLPMALGESIGGETYIADLAKMPHLLIAGTTGSGKSVGVNAMILSILYRLRPDQCRFIMIDPKMLELSVYDGIPHLLAPVVTDPKKAIVALKWTVREMENRYRLMSKIGVRNVNGYNEKAREALAKGEHFERTVQTGFDDAGRPVYESEKLTPEPMPYLVVVIDEVADLMMVAGKDIEGAVQRLAQMARAAGIHLIMATQRPSVDVITGTIKANFPTRISFQVTSKIDARTILGEQGAEQLLGQGDMLYMAGGGRITRLHGPFVSDQEVEDVARFLRDQGVPNYLEEVTEAPDEDEGGGGAGAIDGESLSANDLYDQAVAIVTRDKKASTSYVQRRLQIGYNRAASLIERMEKEGVVSAANHAGKREILAPPPPPL